MTLFTEVKIITGRLHGAHTIANERYFWRVEVQGCNQAGGFKPSAIEALMAAVTEAANHDSSYASVLQTLRRETGVGDVVTVVWSNGAGESCYEIEDRPGDEQQDKGHDFKMVDERSYGNGL